ncbi:MAG: aminotransferase class V-fold PLP-dependent enzyme, partial [Emcibacteraceae bacterium]|nr:aminotransferase class V-fold PLP-dependent enzyme [Emcibacteraceae bacterium]
MSFPIEEVRKKFPSLSLKDEGVARVYLDNPAGTQVPKSVAEAIYNYLMNDSANMHGAFITSKNTVKLVADTHRAMADFMGTDDPDEIIIGASTTALSFHLSRSIFRDFKE